MRQWLVLYRKEMMELSRSYKWLWLPLVFVMLGVMQPVTTYYMPQIIDEMGGLPEGAVIEIPLPTAPQVLAETLGQYGSIGILIIVLAFMGIVSAERTSGAAVMVLVKPVSRASYVTAKWAAMSVVITVSLLLGMGASWYYTDVLIGETAAVNVLLAVIVYLVWLLLIASLVLCLSAKLRAQGAAAFITLLLAIGLSVLTSVLSKWMEWSPSRLSAHASLLLEGQPAGDGFLLSLLTAIAAIALLLWGAVTIVRAQEIGD